MKQIKKSFFRRIYKFLFIEDSVLSWFVSIILAFLLIFFIIYPTLSFVLQTPLPVVAVVSGSMEHKGVPPCAIESQGICIKRHQTDPVLCSQRVEQTRFTLSRYWDVCGDWYEENMNITQSVFSQFSFSNGFNTGDVMVIRGYSAEELQIGDTIIFISDTQKPIIHRLVDMQWNNSQLYLTTKGDHNAKAKEGFPDNEVLVPYDQYVGTAIFRIPYVGYVKIWFEVFTNMIFRLF